MNNGGRTLNGNFQECSFKIELMSKWSFITFVKNNPMDILYWCQIFMAINHFDCIYLFMYYWVKQDPLQVYYRKHAFCVFLHTKEQLMINIDHIHSSAIFDFHQSEWKWGCEG